MPRRAGGGGAAPAYPESAHPYAHNLTGEDENSFWEYAYPGEAAALVVHFDSQTEIVHWSDCLEITDVQPLTAAQYAEIKNSGFTISDSAITGYTGTESHITIPASLGGISITAIAKEAFKYNNTIESVVISEGITTIGSCAFYDCNA